MVEIYHRHGQKSVCKNCHFINPSIYSMEGKQTDSNEARDEPVCTITPPHPPSNIMCLFVAYVYFLIAECQ